MYCLGISCTLDWQYDIDTFFKTSKPTSEGADFIIQNSWDSSWEESEYPTIPYKDFNKFYEL